MPSCIAYLRVSTSEQSVDGVSLAAQSERIGAWATANGYTLGEVFQDTLSGRSASNRPGLQAALDATCKQRAALVVYSLSRLARSVRDALDIADRLGRCGCDLVSLSERIDTSSAGGRLLFSVLAVVATWEREAIVERTKTAMAHLRGQRRRISRFAPYGWRLGADGRTLEPVRAEIEVVASMRRLREAGASYPEIADAMARGGVATKLGGRWSSKSVRAILLRPGADAA
jgi:site-specific DNA recombinase